jgi:hypothetical protein
MGSRCPERIKIDSQMSPSYRRFECEQNMLDADGSLAVHRRAAEQLAVDVEQKVQNRLGPGVLRSKKG